MNRERLHLAERDWLPSMQTRPRTRKRFSLAITVLSILSLLSTGLTIALVWGYMQLTSDLPAIQAVIDQLSTVPQPTRLLDRSGEAVLYTVQNPAVPGRPQLTIDAEEPDLLPAQLISATLAVEDPGFWQHQGIEWTRIADPHPVTLAEKLLVQFDIESGDDLFTALRRRLLAVQLTQSAGQWQVLDWYLNQASYGRLLLGAEAASQAYLGKSAIDLSAAEAALIASIPAEPALNPQDSPQRAEERRQAALQAMLDHGYLTPQETVAASDEMPAVRGLTPQAELLNNPVLQYALEQLQIIAGERLILRGGLQVRTSLNADYQAQSACLINVLQTRLSGKRDAPAPDDCPAARLLPAISSSESVSITQQAFQVLILDPRSGEILAWVADGPLSSRTDWLSPRPAGTALTPFAGLAAFTRGFSPASLVWDLPTQGQPTPLLDPGYDGPMRLRNAIANDDLQPLVALLDQVGDPALIRSLRTMNLGEAIDSNPDGLEGILWGEGQTGFENLSLAYAILANQGTQANRPAPQGSQLPVNLIVQVQDQHGALVFAVPAVQSTPLISQELVYLLNDVLSDETARWRTLGHPHNLEIGVPVAAKLGQTETGADGWAIGYTPEILVAVWFGDLSSSPQREFSTQAASAAWHALAQHIIRPMGAVTWPRPAGISEVLVCDPSGLLPTSDCPDVVREVFATGSEPLQSDSLFQSLPINQESGKLATVFTPLELVDERVYLVIPAEAQVWAQAAGLPIPPEEYDLLTPAAQDGGAQLLAPAPFSVLPGAEIAIRGRPGSNAYRNYRVLIGSGVNPQSWQVLAEGSPVPASGILAEWDTRHLDGLFAIQVQFTNTEQTLQSATVLVSVDAQPPQISILSPLDASQVDLTPNRPLLFSADLDDNLQIASASFYLDDRLLGQRTQAPWVYPWQAGTGEHTLRIVAIDSAGNQSEQTITFIVR